MNIQIEASLHRKLAILADAAKYDASCASSGAGGRNSRDGKGLGSTTGLGHLPRLHPGRTVRFAPEGASDEFLRLRLRFLRQSPVEQHAARPLQGRGSRRAHARLLSPQHDRGIVSLVGHCEIRRPYDGGDGSRRRNAAARPRFPRLHPSQGDRRSLAGSDGARRPGRRSAFGQCRTAGRRGARSSCAAEGCARHPQGDGRPSAAT